MHLSWLKYSLERQRLEREEEKTSDELAEIRINIQTFQTDGDKLTAQVNTLAENAAKAKESAMMRELLIQSNAIRQGAKEKYEKVQELKKKERALHLSLDL